MKLFKKSRLSKNMKRYIEILNNLEKENIQKPLGEREICPPETDPQLVVNCLCDLFLGENCYIALPVNAKQANTEILYKILYKHCKAKSPYPTRRNPHDRRAVQRNNGKGQEIF